MIVVYVYIDNNHLHTSIYLGRCTNAPLILCLLRRQLLMVVIHVGVRRASTLVLEKSDKRISLKAFEPIRVMACVSHNNSTENCIFNFI